MLNPGLFGIENLDFPHSKLQSYPSFPNNCCSYLGNVILVIN